MEDSGHFFFFFYEKKQVKIILVTFSDFYRLEFCLYLMKEKGHNSSSIQFYMYLYLYDSLIFSINVTIILRTFDLIFH